MARRRSLNRRSSRRSLNVTELNQNSELLDTRDPLWWKHLEGDITVQQSRFSSNGEMTGPVLNDSSIVNTSELKSDWWKLLDKSSTVSLRRGSTRKSVQVTEPPSESFNSDSSDHNIIRKRRVALGARDKKVGGTENFMAVLKDANSSDNEREERTNRSRDTLLSADQFNPQNQKKNVEDREAETSSDTSSNTNVVLKTRPKPFKERFTRISDGTSGNTESPQPSESPSLPHSSKQQSIVKSSPLRKSPAKNSNVRDSQLMGPPQITTLQKRLSSISRKLDISSEESESDGGSKKKRFSLGKKSQKGKSINPFDEVIEEHLKSQETEQEELEAGNRESSQQHSRNSENGSLASANRSRISGLGKNSTNQSKAESFGGEHSQSQWIDDASDDDDEAMAGNNEGKGENLGISSRSIRLSKRMVHESAYELPPAERSKTPLISDSEEGENSLSPEIKSGRTSRMSLRSNRSATQNSESSVRPPNSSMSKTNTVQKNRGNNSRTRIFSDEDISVEDISYNGRNDNLIQQADRQSPKAKTSVGADKSRRIIQPDGNTVENEAREESISKSIHLQPEALRKSTARPSRSITKTIFINKNQRQATYDTSPMGSEPGIADQSISSNLRNLEKSAGNRSSTSNLYNNIIVPEEIEDEKTAEVFEKSANSRLQAEENARKLRKSVSRKSQKSTEKERFSESKDEELATNPQAEEALRLADKSTNPRRTVTSKYQENFESQKEANHEPEVGDKSISSNSRPAENLRRSRRTVSITPRKKNQNEGSFGREENEVNEKVSQRIGNSGSLESAHEEEPQIPDKTDPRSSSLQLRRKTRDSRKSFASRKRSTSDENSSIDETGKEIHQESGVRRKSVTFAKNQSRNKSKTTNSEASTEDNIDENRENSRSFQPRKKLRNTREHSGINKSRNLILSNENDSEAETEIAREATPVAQYSPPVDQFQENSQSDDNANENEEEKSRKSESNSEKSRASKKSLPLAGSRKSIQTLAKIVESETERSNELAATSKSASFAQASTSQQNVDPDEIADKNNEDCENDRGPSAGKKLSNNARTSDVPVTPKPISSRESLFMRKQHASNSTPLHAQKSITEFFKSKFLQTSKSLTPREVSSSFNTETFKKAREELEKMKKRELEKMKLEAEAKKKKEDDLKKRMADAAKLKKKVGASAKTVKTVDKAFLVNGVVYKPPRLPRPKPWATDRLYHHLWKLMEPKYRISTRIKSEEFIKDLAKAVAFITKRAKYENYKRELKALMIKMARLGIIKTRNDFYDFCYDFMPYEFRVKVTPIMMPGNILTIPYNPEQLRTPLIQQSGESSEESIN
ncbi:enolase-phosphatase E1-like isoform X2 [Venturia canescens]|uniref:enolase-phosphatase E1-like isoform X2 n=1 Tax=Venturia canescens TaxID=32260 RepID=UPI001C9C8BC6|nr:enolase-phosphatase E1-like isoform X2 [Venturia canescens]